MSGEAAGLVNRWWEQYEETAERLHAAGDFEAADDIRTLVDGLRQHEAEARPVAADVQGGTAEDRRLVEEAQERVANEGGIMFSPRLLLALADRLAIHLAVAEAAQTLMSCPQCAAALQETFEQQNGHAWTLQDALARLSGADTASGGTS